MRLIDADQMAVDESEAYMSVQVQITDDLKWLVNFAAHSKIQKLIADTPTVDAEVVVRCKDCKNFKNYGKTSLLIDGKNIKAGWCYRRVRYDEEYRMPQDGFCSYGERKEDKAE